MWDIGMDKPIPDAPPGILNPGNVGMDHREVVNIVGDYSVAQMVVFAHACMLSLALFTLMAAIVAGNRQKFPGLTQKAL